MTLLFDQTNKIRSVGWAEIELEDESNLEFFQFKDSKGKVVKEYNTRDDIELSS